MEREVKFMASIDIYVVVGLRADVFYRFWEPPRAGEVLPKFSVDTNQFLFVGVAGLPAPRCLATAPTRHRPAILSSPAP
jgi:hypothetical protein